MPDFQTPAVNGTPAEQAVAYLLTRVIYDRNLCHHMLDTEALRLCIRAEAQRLGRSEEEVRAWLLDCVAQREKRDGRGADLPVLRKRLDAIDQHVGHMSDRGKINDADYTALCDFVHVDPADWKELAHA